MNDEALIELLVEQQDGCFLVSSAQFSLLNLVLRENSAQEIERCVLPVLKEMVEFKVDAPVDLRLISGFDGREGNAPPPHVIAKRTALSQVA